MRRVAVNLDLLWIGSSLVTNNLLDQLASFTETAHMLLTCFSKLFILHQLHNKYFVLIFV